MRQSSTDFMDKLLEDNSKPQDDTELSKKIGDVIDKKMAKAMEKFEEQISKVVSPANEEQETESQDEEKEEDINNEEQGSKEE